MSSMSTFTQISRPLHGLFISIRNNSFMRCDLHVHSTASGMCNTPGLTRVCRESYNDPAEVYDRLKRLGMSIVTMTDHDSIDAADVLRRHPDFFLSEEVTVQMPSGCEMHLGVYGIGERDHAEIQRRRNDFIALLMYLTERKLFFSVNHVFSGLTGRREEDDFNWFASYVPAFEVRNGQMWPEANASAERLAKRLGKIGIAGSDAHTIAGVGLTHTEVPGVRTVDEFLAGLRAGRGIIHGVHGSYAKLTADVYRIVKSFFCEKPWALPVLPITVLVPAITAGHWLNEMRFCRKWSAALESEEKRPRMLWKLDPSPEANLAS
jgi:predicted metal-dependent phosphoesterase TrpH